MAYDLNIEWKKIKADLVQDLQFLFGFFKNPLVGIRSVPSWSWPSQLIFLLILSAGTGFLTGLVAKSFLALLAGLFILPLSAIVLVLITSGFFYYVALFVFDRQLPFQKLSALVLLASVPTFFLNIISPLIGLASLVGLGLSALLLMVGLVENFKLPKKPTIKIVAALYAVILLLWLLNTLWTLRETRNIERMHQQKTHESLDILEQELRRGR